MACPERHCRRAAVPLGRQGAGSSAMLRCRMRLLRRRPSLAAPWDTGLSRRRCRKQRTKLEMAGNVIAHTMWLGQTKRTDPLDPPSMATTPTRGGMHPKSEACTGQPPKFEPSTDRATGLTELGPRRRPGIASPTSKMAPT